MPATLFALCLLTVPCYSFKLDASFLKETEKKHMRVAMLAVPFLASLKAGGVEDPSAWLSLRPAADQLLFFSASAILEAGATLPRYKEDLELKDDVVPGNVLGVDPVPPYLEEAEDAVGRVSMLAAFAWIVQDVLLNAQF